MNFDPLDVVENVLSAENLPFDRTDDGDLAFALAGDWKDYEMWFAWRPETDCLQLCCSLDLRTPKSKRSLTLPKRAVVALKAHKRRRPPSGWPQATPGWTTTTSCSAMWTGPCTPGTRSTGGSAR